MQMYGKQSFRLRQRKLVCLLQASQQRSITTVPALASWNIDTFRTEAFDAGLPRILPSSDQVFLEACNKWFARGPEDKPRLNRAFWTQYADLVVPLEITRSSNDVGAEVVFEKVEAPLSLLLYDMEKGEGGSQSIYLAQHDIRDLPQPLQDDLPTPKLVLRAGKGDIYSSSLWLGRSPTYTPLHRDPNPNLLTQLAGIKVVRLFPPQIGQAIFEQVQLSLGHGTGFHHRVRGEEMMAGAERSLLHDLVWKNDTERSRAILQHAQEARISSQQALFLPTGWWHSVKGIGDGITASANWWFR